MGMSLVIGRFNRIVYPVQEWIGDAHHSIFYSGNLIRIQLSTSFYNAVLYMRQTFKYDERKVHEQAQKFLIDVPKDSFETTEFDFWNLSNGNNSFS
jgi:hypothetical protein